jgi:hypothetical protein
VAPPSSSPPQPGLVVDGSLHLSQSRSRECGAPTRGCSLISNLEEAIQVPSKSGRDLDHEAFSDQFESDPTSPGGTLVEVALKMDVLSI